MAKTNNNKVSTTTIEVCLARTEKIKDESNNVIFKYVADKVLIPLNVVDSEYFEFSVQFWCNIFIEERLQSALNNALDKYSDGLITEEEEEKFETSLDDWKGYVNTYKSNVLEVFEEDIFNTFYNDGFARIYAIMILNQKKINGVDIRFNASSVDMSEVSELIKGLNPAVKITDSYKKNIIDKIHQFCNDNFATNGGELYKNINYNSLSFDKLQNELYTRCKKPMKVNRKGKGFDNVYLSAFEMCIQLLYVCLHTQGIPFIDGNKVVTIFNGSVGATDKLSATRKKK